MEIWDWGRIERRKSKGTYFVVEVPKMPRMGAKKTMDYPRGDLVTFLPKWADDLCRLRFSLPFPPFIPLICIFAASFKKAQRNATTEGRRAKWSFGDVVLGATSWMNEWMDLKAKKSGGNPMEAEEPISRGWLMDGYPQNHFALIICPCAPLHFLSHSKMSAPFCGECVQWDCVFGREWGAILDMGSGKAICGQNGVKWMATAMEEGPLPASNIFRGTNYHHHKLSGQFLSLLQDGIFAPLEFNSLHFWTLLLHSFFFLHSFPFNGPQPVPSGFHSPYSFYDSGHFAMPLATSGGQIKHWSIGKFGVRDFNWMNATERNGRKMWNGGNKAIK